MHPQSNSYITIAVALPMVDQGNMFRQANKKATPFPVSRSMDKSLGNILESGPQCYTVCVELRIRVNIGIHEIPLAPL